MNLTPSVYNSPRQQNVAESSLRLYTGDEEF